MNNIGSVKEEYLGSSSISEFDVGKGYCSNILPQPMGGLNETGPPPFLSKTYDFVEDESTNEIVSWSRGNNSFIVLDPQRFAINLLPKYFKHSNFSSFVRQLNTYGFRKVDPDRWEFANEGFLRGKRHLLKNIRRKTSSNIPQSSSTQSGLESCVEVGRFGLDAEIDSLRRDKHVLTVELVKLRQQQQNTKAYLQEMEQRLKGTELKQQQTLSFLARAIRNPVFLQQMVQQKERRKEIEEAIGKKRRKKIDHGSRSSSDVYISFDGVGVEDLELGHFEGGDISAQVDDLELEKVAMSMPAEALESAEEHVAPTKFVDEEWMHSSAEKPFDQGFWEGLMNEGIDHHGFGVQGVLDDEGVDILTEQLGFLGSNPR